MPYPFHLSPNTRFRLVCTHEIDADGDVILVFPPPVGFWKRLLYGNRSRRVQLEKMGSAVIKACLSGACWEEIPGKLETLFPEQKDLTRRSELFIRHLLERGWLQIEKSNDT